MEHALQCQEQSHTTKTFLMSFTTQHVSEKSAHNYLRIQLILHRNTVYLCMIRNMLNLPQMQYRVHRKKIVLCFVNFPRVLHHLVNAIFSIAALDTYILDRVYTTHIMVIPWRASFFLVCFVWFCCCCFGCTAWLMGSQVPHQGLNLGLLPGSESLTTGPSGNSDNQLLINSLCFHSCGQALTFC